MQRLNQASLGKLPATVKVPGYVREQTRIGIVHLGPGAFHRAHQAVYTDDALAFGGHWGICAVSMRSRGVKENLAEQDNLYTLAVIDNDSRNQVIGAIKEVLVLGDDREQVMTRLCSPETHIISLTITEKGYCLNGDGGLDQTHADIQQDLANPDAPVSAVGLIVLTLQRRFAAGIGELTVLSCDNLADNGHKLARAVYEYAQLLDAALAEQIRAEVRFPCSMVDSITPATDDALKVQVSEALGVQDNWPIQRESFTQWVIENNFSGPRPAWEQVGVTFTDDVSGYEKAKLRILNGSHSSLAYLGILCGRETVFEGISDPDLAAFIDALLTQEVIPSLNPPAELDLVEYKNAILARYRNPHIRHLLAQIAWDGSQKLPFRLLGTVADNLAAGRSVKLLSVGVAAWFHFLRFKLADGSELVDPLANVLLEAAAKCQGGAEDVAHFLALGQVFSKSLADNPNFVSALKTAYVQLATLQETGAHSLTELL